MTRKILLAVLLVAAAATASAQPEVIAHRGYWTVAGSAQNSLSSLAKADSIGVYGSEFDVWLTADDQIVVNHDRIYGDTGIDMERSTLAEIGSIVLPNGERIPTLEAYLDLATGMPRMRLILELKALSDSGREELAAKKIVRAVEKRGLLDRTDFISFSLDACLAFRKFAPDARVYYLSGDLTPEQIAARRLSGIDYRMDVLRAHPEWIREAHRLGLEVNVWTVDSEEDMRDFIGMGVDYITTNYPERLQALLAE